MNDGLTFAVRPVALTKPDAARVLSMSVVDSFIRRGRLRLIPVAELERWVDENAEQRSCPSPTSDEQRIAQLEADHGEVIA